MAVCYRIVNFKCKEFSLSYSELFESCTSAESTSNLEPIVYKYNSNPFLGGDFLNHYGLIVYMRCRRLLDTRL